MATERWVEETLVPMGPQDNGTEKSLSPMSSTSQGICIGIQAKEMVSSEEMAPGQTEESLVILREIDCPESLATAWPSWKKWMVLTIVFIVQTSMNFNCSLYANGQAGIVREFNVKPQAAVSGAGVFLLTYAIGCELWAPWSEEFGRRLVLQASLLLVNVCCVIVALAHYCHYFPAIIIGRAFGGLFSAGGSVTLGMVADMFSLDQQESPLAFIVLSSVGGSIIGPIIGGFVEENLEWTWTIWIQLIFGVFAQLLHFRFVPETRSSILLDKHASWLRKMKINPLALGPNEHKSMKDYLAPRDLLSLWARPFKMFAKERIVLVLSLLSGFSDALIFMQIQSFARVFKLWDFSTVQIGLAFISIGIAYIVAYLLFIPVTRRNRAFRQKNPLCERAQYESRLWWLLFTAPLLPIGLLIFAWTSTPAVHWIAPMVGCVFIGIANYSIYMTSIDYMVAAYGPYSASATGGNGFARDLLAGLLTWAAAPYYDSFSFDKGLQVANTLLAGVSIVLVVASVYIYRKGPSMRRRSPFAQSLSGNTGSVAVEPPSASV
ncbi:major facilitator superfamily domain-containing protein [Hypoxylon fuscum]|nr:major facilitator superfamily domain-containing protein [Hypoxylon fuscum]